MIDQDFFVRRYAPVTIRMAFFEMPTPEFAQALYERNKVVMDMYGLKVRYYKVDGPFSSMLEKLLPFANNKKLLARNGGWTAYMGGDIGTDARYLGKKLKIRVITAHIIKEVPNEQLGSTVFMLADNRHGDKPKIRALQAMKESRWEWSESGEPFPFEQVEKYSERRIKDRLTFDMVGEYCLNFGIHLFDPDCYESGYIVEEDPFPNATFRYEYPNLKQA